MSTAIFLPGIGGTELLFAKQKKHFPHVSTPPWLAPLQGESVADYARRWAADFQEDCYTLIGTSFGGIVCLELANWLPVSSVVLISSCIEKQPLSPTLGLIERLSRAIPDPAVRWGATRFLPHMVARRNSLSLEDRDLVKAMSREVDIGFTRWACRAALDWEGPPDSFAFKVSAIHGDQDPIFPKISHPDIQIVSGGGHMLTLTHPETVVEFLREAL